MKPKEELNETPDFFTDMREYIETLEETNDNNSQINGILYLFKIIANILETDYNTSTEQNELLNNYTASSKNLFCEHEEKITKLNELIIEIGEIVNKLTDDVKKITELTAEVPIINVENLLKTLNEHTEEINDIKRKLN